ncbi:MAG: cysteine synthase family protein [Candidatus Micrarchaeota archaeon]
MKTFGKNILETIGNTPLIEIGGIWAKLETTNPTGSIKDRMAWNIIRRAEERGELREGMEILEVTSGNTGISFSMLSAIRGYGLTAVMPESMSIMRRRMIEKFGGKIVLTPAEKDMAGAIAEYERLVALHPDWYLPNQFKNPDNPDAHYRGTAEEILEQMPGKIGAFVAGAGTGGTLIGTGRRLKEEFPDIRIVAVEPMESAVLSGKQPGHHEIQGIGEGFIPELLQRNLDLVDEIIAIPGVDAISMADKLAKEHGILVGTSSGANYLAAQKLKEKNGEVVTIFPDRGERYLSDL